MGMTHHETKNAACITITLELFRPWPSTRVNTKTYMFWLFYKVLYVSLLVLLWNVNQSNLIEFVLRVIKEYIHIYVYIFKKTTSIFDNCSYI